MTGPSRAPGRSHGEVEIKPLDSGPYLVTGEIDLLDCDGNVCGIEKATTAPCRCGASENKPFCDGSHSRIGFSEPERAG